VYSLVYRLCSSWFTNKILTVESRRCSRACKTRHCQNIQLSNKCSWLMRLDYGISIRCSAERTYFSLGDVWGTMSTVSTSGTVHSARAVASVIRHSRRRVCAHLRFRVTGRWTALILNANSQNAPDLHVQRESNAINHHVGFHAMKVFLFSNLFVTKWFLFFPTEINSGNKLWYPLSSK
jgi:hypothetical protein